mmetsp:Transcript_30872/g.45144  ORF Transcript_30872/g.45144 Transcript_30872/m.45144 type:complete len:310 (+) Transcript_30872:52-981(+)
MFISSCMVAHLIIALLLYETTNATKVTIEIEPAPSEWNSLIGDTESAFIRVAFPNATNGCFPVCDENSGDQHRKLDEVPENCTNVRNACGGSFELDLRSNDRLEFVLRPPPSSTNDEVVLKYPLDGDTVDIVFEANGECQNTLYRNTQIFPGSHIDAAVTGSKVSTLTSAYEDEESFISINDGCGIFTRLRFRVSRPNEQNNESVLGSFTEMRWSTAYDGNLTAEGSLLYKYGTLEEAVGGSSSSISASVEVKEVEPKNNNPPTVTPPNDPSDKPTKDPTLTSSAYFNCAVIFYARAILFSTLFSFSFF